MKTREQIDPELHTLRTIARRPSHGAGKSQLESARFNLYVAFEEGNPDAACRWARAVRAGLLVVDEQELRTLGLDALAAIE